MQLNPRWWQRLDGWNRGSSITGRLASFCAGSFASATRSGAISTKAACCAPPTLRGDVPTVHTEWRFFSRVKAGMSAVLTGAWALPGERRMIMVFGNISDQPVTATVHFDAAAYGFKADSVRVVTVTHNGASEPMQESAAFEQSLTFAPHNPWAREITW